MWKTTSRFFYFEFNDLKIKQSWKRNVERINLAWGSNSIDSIFFIRKNLFLSFQKIFCIRHSTWFCQFSSIIFSNIWYSIIIKIMMKKKHNWNEYVSVPIKILKIKSIYSINVDEKFHVFKFTNRMCQNYQLRETKNNKISKNKLFIHRMNCQL